MSRAPLTWGDLDLFEDGASATYTVAALSTEEGTDFGNPVPIEVAVRSLLQDGSIVFSQGHDNREMPLAVTVQGLTMEALAEAEAAFMAQVGRAGVNLLWRGAEVNQPAPVTVFEVVTSSLDWAPDDLAEVSLRRRYGIRLVCLPWARSESLTVSEAPAAIIGAPGTPEVTVDIDTCSSTTGWSANGGSVVSSNGGTAVKVSGTDSVSLTRSGTVDFSATPLLVVDRAGSGGSIVKVYAGGVLLTRVSSTASPLGSGFQRDTFSGTPATVNSIRIVTTGVYSGQPLTITVTNLARTNAGNQPSGTARQLVRRLPIGGSVRTQGSILVEHETSALGEVLAYTWADEGSGYSPPLRPYRTGGGVSTTDTSLVSGVRDSLDSTTTFLIPADAVPDGDYVLFGRLRSDATGVKSLTATFRTLVNGVAVGPTKTLYGSMNFGIASNWKIGPLAAVTLPVTRLGGTPAAQVEVTIVATDTLGTNIDLDEAWLFNQSIGALTQAACGTGAPSVGGPSRRLWIEPETVASRSTILRGDAADQSDAFYVLTEQAAIHEMRPGGLNVFTVTTGALDAKTTVSAFNRWHSHARD